MTSSLNSAVLQLLLLSCWLHVTTPMTSSTPFQSLLLFFQQTVTPMPDTTLFHGPYDFIVIGGGSAGSVVASRLSEVPHWSVLLLEAGTDENFLTDIPLAANIGITTSYAERYRSGPEDSCCLAMAGRGCPYIRGKALGGSSVVNYLVYTRGSRGDYDTWEELGNRGWSYEDVLPYFKKSEDVRIEELKSDNDERATGGYLSVDHAPWRTPLSDAFLDAAGELGYKMADLGARTQEGCARIQATIRDGQRWSTAKAFLQPARYRPNLRIVKHAHVTRVIVDDVTKHAYGVEFIKHGRRHVLQATKEVVLSAGTMGSPHLLMLSGIGPVEHLQEHGIPVIQDLPVGYNLQDHVDMPGLVFTVNDTVTLLEQRLLLSPIPLLEYVTRRTGPLTLPGGAEALVFARTKYAARSVDPDVELVFAPGTWAGVLSSRAQESFGFPQEFTRGLFRDVQNKDAYSIVPALLKPKSRGRIMLRSGNPMDRPAVKYNLLSEEDDVRVLLEAIKIALSVSTTSAMQRYASRLNPTPCPGCEQQVFQSDEYWICCMRRFTFSLQHQVGTCKMGPDDDAGAVVDSQLRVRGISGLRVVDASIMPVIPSAHTNAAVVMIAEKISDVIKTTWL